MKHSFKQYWSRLAWLYAFICLFAWNYIKYIVYIDCVYVLRWFVCPYELCWTCACVACSHLLYFFLPFHCCALALRCMVALLSLLVVIVVVFRFVSLAFCCFESFNLCKEYAERKRAGLCTICYATHSTHTITYIFVYYEKSKSTTHRRIGTSIFKHYFASRICHAIK